MNTIMLFIVLFVLVLVLALQLQVRQTDKKLDHFLKRMGSFTADVRKYASLRDNKD